MPYLRSAYKDVWNALSSTYKDAVTHVQGDVGEDELRSAGQETLKDLQSTVGVKIDDLVLEIGCGVGRVGKIIAPLCKEWIGCDVSPNMLVHARARLEGLVNVQLIETSGYELKPIPDSSIDIVYCTVVFMHLDEWDRFNYVLEAMRVLRPSGRVFVDNFNLCDDTGWKLFEILRTSFAPEQRPSHISKSSTPAEIETYLIRAGFRSVQVREKNGWVQGWGHRE
jgi:ubiquinone/menaquinone biosynthesis C-methylase UbiE